MKTEALGQVIRFAADQLDGTEREGLSYEADAELRDLEDSHRTLKGILADMLLEDGHLHECQYVNTLGTCSARCANTRAALKKAGAL